MTEDIKETNQEQVEQLNQHKIRRRRRRKEVAAVTLVETPTPEEIAAALLKQTNRKSEAVRAVENLGVNEGTKISGDIPRIIRHVLAYGRKNNIKFIFDEIPPDKVIVVRVQPEEKTANENA